MSALSFQTAMMAQQQQQGGSLVNNAFQAPPPALGLKAFLGAVLEANLTDEQTLGALDVWRLLSQRQGAATASPTSHQTAAPTLATLLPPTSATTTPSSCVTVSQSGCPSVTFSFDEDDGEDDDLLQARSELKPMLEQLICRTLGRPSPRDWIDLLAAAVRGNPTYPSSKIKALSMDSGLLRKCCDILRDEGADSILDGLVRVRTQDFNRCRHESWGARVMLVVEGRLYHSLSASAATTTTAGTAKGAMHGCDGSSRSSTMSDDAFRGSSVGAHFQPWLSAPVLQPRSNPPFQLLPCDVQDAGWRSWMA